MGRPSVLVLDEPVNGLDIEGVLWIRQLVTQHAQSGGTVLLATHLLREAQGLADRVVMIDRGKIVANAHPDELIDDSWSAATTTAPEALAELLGKQNIDFQRNKTQFTVRCTPESLGELTAAHRLPLTRLDTAADSSLERIFLDRTSGEFAIPTEKTLDPS
ncbi:MAG: ABC transporter ATP-binding protein, partial [Angustibacter sp.]